jgi:importin subunit alpha-6/7
VTQQIIDENTLPCLLALLSSPEKGIRKDACRAIGNITGTSIVLCARTDCRLNFELFVCLQAGNKFQIQAVIESNIIPPLIQLLANAESDIRNEAAWAIHNATIRGNEFQIMYLVQQGCIRPLCDLLTSNDPTIVTIALNSIENILKVGETESVNHGGQNQMTLRVAEADGLNKIEELRSKIVIYDKCIKIIETYFRIEDEADVAAIAPLH